MIPQHAQHFALRHGHPVRIAITSVRGRGFISGLIAYICTPFKNLKPWGRGTYHTPSHTAITFEMADGTGWYFEAHANTDWTGPKEERHLRDSRRFHWVRHYWFGSEKQCVLSQKLIRAIIGRQKYRYSIAQLVRMYFYRRFRLPLSETPEEVVCSEMVGNLLWPQWDSLRILREDGYANLKTLDYLTPLDMDRVGEILAEVTEDVT